MGSGPEAADGLADRIDEIAVEEGLSGVIRVDLDGKTAFQRAYGLAHRGLGILPTIDTQFAVASGWTNLLVVMGHSDCGAIKAAQDGRVVVLR